MPNISSRRTNNELSQEGKVAKRIFWWPFYELVNRREVWTSRAKFYDEFHANVGVSMNLFVAMFYCLHTRKKKLNDQIGVVPTLVPLTDVKSSLTEELSEEMHNEISMLANGDDVNKR